MHVWEDDRVFVSVDRGDEYDTRHSCRKAIHIAHEADTDSKQCGLNEIAKK